MLEYRFPLLRPIAKAGAVMMLVALATAGSVFSKSESGGTLAGSWSGGGWVSFASGNKERARCHAHYSRAGGSSYELSASCATASSHVWEQDGSEVLWLL